MNWKKFLLPFIIVALAFSLAACGNGDKEETEQDANEEGQVDQKAIDEMNEKLAKQQVEEDTVVAVVNDEELDGQKYNTVLQNIQVQYQEMGIDPTTEEIAEQIQTHTLNEVVNQTLLLQQAQAENIEVLPEEIDNEYGMLVEQYGGEEVLEGILENEGIEKEAFLEQIESSILYSKYIESVAPTEEISDEDVEAYYDEIAAQSEETEELPPLEDLSEMIRDNLAQETQQQKIMAHLEELKEEATIELKI